MKLPFYAGLLSSLLLLQRSYAYNTDSDFAQLVREHVEIKSPFVDKTLFIRDFISSKFKYMIVTRPPKWGKSVNLNMLYQFLAIEVDFKGNRKDEDSKIYKPVFHQGKLRHQNLSDEQYPRLKIADCPSLIEKNQGKWPVLKLDFSNVMIDLPRYSWEWCWRLREKFRRVVKATLETDYGYLLLSYQTRLGLDDSEYASFYKYAFKDKGEGIDVADIRDFIYLIVKALYNFFNKTPIYVLIDGYDQFVNHIVFEQKRFDYPLNKVLEIFEAVYSALQCFELQAKIKKVLMTGTLPYLQTSCHNKLNNYHLISVTDETFAEYYGFTRAEVETLINVTPKLENPHTILTNMIEWYNGYQIGNVKVLNPWSVRASLYRKGETNIYWKYTDQFADIYTKNDITNEELRHAFELMISTNGTIPSPPFSKPFGYTDLSETKASFSLLLHQGLLTANRVFVDGRTVLRYSIPNRETHDLIYQEILHYEMKNLGAAYEDLIIRSKNPITYLTQAKIELFENDTQILLNTYCTAPTIKTAESFHWLMETLIFATLCDRYRVVSERDFDSGGTLWRLIPIRRTDCAHLPVVILGYKFVNSEYELVSACKKVINEIIAKNYIGDIEVGSRAVYYVGTAVSKWKHFKVKYACPLQNGTLLRGDNGNEERYCGR